METTIGQALGGLGSLVTLPLRAYLTQLLRDQLAHYVQEDCINFQRLTLGGTLVLENLELKTETLRDLFNIPLTFEISRGFIRKLQVNVPWTNLLGQPITVKIDTVMIEIRMKTDVELTKTAESTLNANNDGTNNKNNSSNNNDHAADPNTSTNTSSPQEQKDVAEEGWVTGLGKYSKRRERASRNGSTVVDISIPPPSFKPVSLSLLRISSISKTPKQVVF